MSWTDVFCGRADELGVLKEAWGAVSSAAPEPRFVVFVGESGLGKTRIVQEFYNWLSTTTDGVEGEGYWPDRLTESGNNLRLNPPPDLCNADNPVPYLWWGMRMPDPEGRNAARGGVAADVDLLRPHLEPFARSRVLKERWRKLHFQPDGGGGGGDRARGRADRPDRGGPQGLRRCA